MNISIKKVTTEEPLQLDAQIMQYKELYQFMEENKLWSEFNDYLIHEMDFDLMLTNMKNFYFRKMAKELDKAFVEEALIMPQPEGVEPTEIYGNSEEE